MKSYKEYGKKFIGESDIASLVMVGFGTDDVETGMLHFGSDGAYDAYIVDGEAEIGAHYEKVATFKSWFRLYDDGGLTVKTYGREINVYRAGEMGCIIQAIQ